LALNNQVRESLVERQEVGFPRCLDVWTILLVGCGITPTLPDFAHPNVAKKQKR